MEIGKRGNCRGDETREGIIREIKNSQVSKFGDKWRKSTGVTGRVEGELGDASGGGVAEEAARKGGAARESAGIGGEIPRS